MIVCCASEIGVHKLVWCRVQFLVVIWSESVRGALLNLYFPGRSDRVRSFLWNNLVAVVAEELVRLFEWCSVFVAGS